MPLTSHRSLPPADAPHLSLIAPMPSQYTNNILADRPLLIAFMPVFSAISGNIGLQSSAINARRIGIGANHC